MKEIKTKIVNKATAALEDEIQKELDIADPTEEQAQAVLKPAEGEPDDS